MPDAHDFRRAVLPTATALALGAAGGWMLEALGVPGGWLAGSALATAAAALGGLPVGMPVPLRNVTYVVLGLSMGAGVTPDTLARLADWPISIALLLLTVVAVTAAVQFFLVRIAGWDAESAFFGALPGALSYVVAAAASRGVDVRRVAISQSVRLLFLIAILPVAIGHGQHAPAREVAAVAVAPLLLLVAAAAVTGWVMDRLRMPAGLLGGAFLASAVLHATGIVTQSLPGTVAIAAFVVLGAFVGSRFASIRWADFLRLLLSSLGALAVGLAVSVAGAAAAAWATGIALPQILIAFAPGGLDAMIALAYLLRIDPAFVAIHQLIRFAAIAIALPFVVPLIARRAP